MTAIHEILKTINNLKEKNNLLSKGDIRKLLIATKSITQHKDLIDSMIFLFTTQDHNIQKKIACLTKRELQILQQIGYGKNTKDIALLLNIKNSTIETHRKNIRKKLDLVGKGKLIQYAILNNLRASIS
ncbi:helix-turn-helix transcriptional regulator [Flavivirga algicola]|uniref:Helix-turn-helix transcriptional regulator n=1 Tax=Flavivirga algicola TaxID=2729136 RepID=A0ABX1RSJ7_9FLAO|nr:helix-turn-helix transcriptional regulator [Flavivirga algicola]NMH86516.1 helix-turn-helix transcriptional regulator [Flavivirga algicola]